MREIDKLRNKSIDDVAEMLAIAYANGYHTAINNGDKAVLDYQEVKRRMQTTYVVGLAKEVQEKADIEKGKKMENKTMKVVLDEGATMPTRAYPTDAGLDLYSREEKVILPRYYSYTELGTGKIKGLPMGETFDTGVHVALPEGTYGRIEGRSGLNIKNDVVVCGGTIDQNFTGSIRVKLYNLGSEPYIVHSGDRIAQLVILQCEHPVLEEVEALPFTDRDTKGIGSSGK